MTDLQAETARLLALRKGTTPGPWMAESGHEQSNGQLYWQVTDGSDAIMQNQFCWCKGDHAANARLIAAAPDMLDAIAALQAKLEAAEAKVGLAALDVIAERCRQVSKEGWREGHDDSHRSAELSVAAACYALSSAGWVKTAIWEIWPKAFGVAWFKPTDSRRDLVKAGALILAEIERLDRAALAEIGGGNG